MQIRLADMAYEVLIRSWRPMTPSQLRGAILEVYAVNPDDAELSAALPNDGRFTIDSRGRSGLDEFRWPHSFGFSYIDVRAIG